MKWLSHKTMMFSVRLGTVQSSTEVTIDNRYRVYNFFPHSVMYDGQCRDLYEDGICALGERLFLIEGNPQCECDGDEVNKYQIISAFTISFFLSGLVEARRTLLPRVHSGILWGKRDPQPGNSEKTQKRTDIQLCP